MAEGAVDVRLEVSPEICDIGNPILETMEIGHYSVDEDGNFQNDDSALRYFNPSQFNYDDPGLYLNSHLESVSWTEYSRDIDKILRWMQSNQTEPAEFVCRRGLLKTLMCTPYEKNEGWKVAAALYDGTYYLREYETIEERQRASLTETERKMCLWGWKFEQYLTASTEGGYARPHEPSNGRKIYRSVVRSTLKKHTLSIINDLTLKYPNTVVYVAPGLRIGPLHSLFVDSVANDSGAKVAFACRKKLLKRMYDGEIDAQVKGDLKFGDHYVEFKTNKEVIGEDNDWPMEKFKRFKLRSLWAQSYLVGVPKAVIGFRDDNGRVLRMKGYTINEIPGQVQDIRNPWKPRVCLNFLDKFLTCLKGNVKDDRAVYLFEWSPHNAVTCTRLVDNKEYTVLPEWYTNGSP